MRTLVPLLLLAVAAAAGKDAEAKAKERIAKVWIDYARWCKVQGLKEEAAAALADARALDPEAKDLARLAEEIEGLDGGGTRDAPGLERRREKARQDAAKYYDRLAKLDHAPEDAARFEGYLFEAARLDPSRSRLRRIEARIEKLASNQRTADDAGRLLVRLQEVDPEGDYAAIEVELARKDVCLIKAPGHPMVGWLSLPKSWRKGGELPVLVAVEGAGCGFLGRARDFAKTRGGRDWIVLAPCALSNTNELKPEKYPFYRPERLEEWNRDRIGFDLAGLEALLATVKERFGGGERFAITGFSGGGNLCYAMTVRAPQRVLFAAPACANFSGAGFSGAAAPDGGGPPIRILTGEKDPHRDHTHGNENVPGIEPQTDRAVAVLEELGYTDLTRTMLPGVGHSACSREVWEIADVLAKRR